MKTIKEKNEIAKEEAEGYIGRFKDVLSCDIMGYGIRPKVYPSNEDNYKLTKDACFLAMEHLNLKRLGCFNTYGEFENKYDKKKFQYYDRIYNQVVKIRKQVKK
jgi:hypothetical protein